MVDRQDIDALLVGALYGELTPAEEARLQTHLESHPADRGALDDLKSARAAVRESRVFDLQAEPPQAVSALLLQEAHRRAPRRAPEEHARESWLARLARSFIVHPAMAAAATLVLVIGVAGGLYLHKGGDQLDRRAASADKADKADKVDKNDETVAASAPAMEPRAVASGAAAGSAAAATNGDDSYDVSLGDKKLGNAEAQKVAPVAPALAASPPKAVSHASRSDGIVVTRPEVQPKDLDRAKGYGYKADGEVARDLGGVSGGGRASSGLGYGPSSNASTPAPAPAGGATPPPPPVEQAPAAAPVATPTAPKSRKTMADDEDAPMTKETSKANEDDQWAASRHDAAVKLAGADKCDDAANAADAIRQQAPAYYQNKVADDIRLKHCLSYVHNKELAEKRAAKKPAPAKAKAAPPADADEKPANATSK